MADEPIGDLPEDPFPNVKVTAVNMDTIAVFIMVGMDGHMSYRANVSDEYALYALDSIRAEVERRIRAKGN